MWGEYHIKLRRQSRKHKAASNSSSEDTITVNSLFHESRAKQTWFPTKLVLVVPPPPHVPWYVFQHSQLPVVLYLSIALPYLHIFLVKWQHVLWQVQCWWIRQHMDTVDWFLFTCVSVEVLNEIFLLYLGTYIYNGLRSFVSLRHPTISSVPLKLVSSFRGTDSCGTFINWQAQVDVENDL